MRAEGQGRARRQIVVRSGEVVVRLRGQPALRGAGGIP